MLPPVLLSPKKRKKKRPRSFMLRFIGFAFTAGVFLFIAASAVAGYFLWQVSRDLPDYDKLAEYEPPVMSRIHANNGNLIAEYARQRRIYVPINTIPKVILQAFLSAEDGNFFEHGGIDFKGVARAVFNHFVKGRRLTGASTITQQVAKNFLLTNERSFTRKLKEAILAIRIERAYSKEKILELYLNEIYLGLSSYGIAAAALNYYGKELSEITVSEAAYFAALPKAPNNYHPFKKTRAALTRRNWVIGQMVKNGFIAPEIAEAAKAEKLHVNPRSFGAHIFAAEYFAEEVRRTLVGMYGEEKLYGGGLSVRTTLDPHLQKLARKALIDGLVSYDQRHGWRGALGTIDISGDWGTELVKQPILSDIHPWKMAVVLEATAKSAKLGFRPMRLQTGKLDDARTEGLLLAKAAKWAFSKKAGSSLPKLLKAGDVIYVAPGKKASKKSNNPPPWRLMQVPKVGGGIVALDPHTGRVLALVGGFSFSASQFDRAVQAKRQPGSAFKPIVYTAALDNGYTPTSIVLDAPIAIEQGGGQDLWKPQNYGKKFYGPSTLRLGIEKSRNLMTVRLAQDMGMPLISEYARRFGVYKKLLPVLSMSLGAGETTLLQMVNAYGMLVNGGRKVDATLIDRIQDRYGKTIWRHDKRQCAACVSGEYSGQDEPRLKDERKQIVDPHSAYQMVSILEGVVKRGTGARVGKALPNIPLAGKTGTTNDEKDAWFVGFSPDMAVGVFVGFDNPKAMGKGETGGGVASPIFRDFMKLSLAGKRAIPFRIPPGIKLIRINRKTGLRARAGEGDTILEAFKPDTEPPDAYSAIGWTSEGSTGGAFGQPQGDSYYPDRLDSGRGLY